MLKRIGAFLKAIVVPIASKVGGVWGWLLGLFAPVVIDKGVEKIEEIIADAQREQAEKKAEQDRKAAKEAAERLKAADQIVDDEKRIQEKVDALCELEKKLNPKSDCDRVS